MVDLSIVIVSWNVSELLVACLHSILRGPVRTEAADGEGPLVEIIVVDSASSDNTVSIVRERFPQVTLLPQDENVGFTRGNNIGLEASSGRYILLLNPDTEIVDDALAHMVLYMEDHADVGILGPRTLNSDGTTQSSRRRFPTIPLAFFESTWLQRFAPRGMLDRFYVNDAADDAIVEVDWVQGSALMARYSVYDQIDGLDEGYIMYSEELDWCRRAKDVGWGVVYLGTAQIVHHGGKSTEQVKARSHIYFQQSKLRYFRKYHGFRVAIVLRIYLLLSYLFQLLQEGVKLMLGSKRDMRRERVRAYWQVVRSGLKVY